MLNKIKNNINWLAQCKKRQSYPVDQADKVGLTAFEYGWKSFNNLYSEFRERTEREKMKKCIEYYINIDDFFDKNKKTILQFCKIDHRIYLKDDDYKSLSPKITIKVQLLKNNIDKNHKKSSINALIDCLYIVRNARIHGSMGTGKIYFSFLPKIILLLNKEIIMNKYSLNLTDLDKLIEDKVISLKRDKTYNKLQTKA